MVRVAVIFLLLSSFLLADYAPNKVIVKLKSSNYSVQNLGTKATLDDLPDSVLKLSKANGALTMQPLVDKATHLQEGNFQTMDEARAHAQKIQSVAEQSGLNRIYEISFAGSPNVPFLVEQFKNDANIEFAQPDYLYKMTVTTPNDTDYSNQEPYLDPVYASYGWDISTGSVSVLIAIIDTGISTNHEDLSGKILAGSGYNYVSNNTNVDDDNGHGTSVAGIAAAIGNNAKGVCGVDWNAKIMPIKALNSLGEGDTTAICKALQRAIDYNAKVINMSFGADGSDPSVGVLCDAAYNNFGILLVAATGNDHKSHIYYPAAYNSVIAVGSIKPSGTRSSFSNYGPGTELMAIGENNFTTITGNVAYANAGSGTSFSCPQVAGLCSLMIAKHPDMSNDKIRLALHNSADDLGPVGKDDEYGYGRINIFQALELVSSYTSDSPAELKDVFNFPNPVTQGKTKFSFKTNKSVKKAVWTIYDLKGREVYTLEEGTGMAGSYIAGYWDCTNGAGNKLANGTYIYVLKVTDGNDLLSYAKGKVTIVN